MDSRHGFGADDEESKIEEMLAICNDESLMKLSINTHSISSSSDSLVLDSDLLARLHKLKTPAPPIPKASKPASPSVGPQASQTASPSVDSQEIDALGAHLASRFAALKQPSIHSPKHSESPVPSSHIQDSPPSDDLSTTLDAPDAFSGRNEEPSREPTSVSSSDGAELEKLLASIKDQVRLAKTKVGEKSVASDEGVADEARDSEDEISDTDVNDMVEWAKDAARLSVCDDDGGDADPVMDKEVRDESNPSRSNCSPVPRKTKKGWKFW